MEFICKLSAIEAKNWICSSERKKDTYTYKKKEAKKEAKFHFNWSINRSSSIRLQFGDWISPQFNLFFNWNAILCASLSDDPWKCGKEISYSLGEWVRRPWPLLRSIVRPILWIWHFNVHHFYVATALWMCSRFFFFRHACCGRKSKWSSIHSVFAFLLSHFLIVCTTTSA